MPEVYEVATLYVIEKAIGSSEIRINLQRFVQQRSCQFETFRWDIMAVQISEREGGIGIGRGLQEIIPSLHVFGSDETCPVRLGNYQLWLDGQNDIADEFVLDFQRILELICINIGPDMITLAVIKLNIDSNQVVNLSDTSLHDISSAQCGRYFSYVFRIILVSKCRSSGDDREALYGLQRRNEVLRDSVCKVFLLGII